MKLKDYKLPVISSSYYVELKEAQDAITKTNEQLAKIKIDKTNFKESQEAVSNLYTELITNLNNKKAELELSLKHTDVNSPEWAELQ
jgi:predicted DNA-binding protein YlxM (UPF0122 family)